MEFDILKSELQSVVDTGLKYGKSLDDSCEYEVFMYYRQFAEANIRQGIVTASDGAIAGNAVRVAKGKRVGFAASSGVSEESVKKSVSEAHSIAQLLKQDDERFPGFAEPATPGKDGIINKDILALGIDDLIEASGSLVKNAQTVGKDVKMLVQAGTEIEWGSYAVGNTHGVQEATLFADNNCVAYVQAIEGEERHSAYGFDVTRERPINIEGVGEKAAKDAIALLGSKKFEHTGKLTTIWNPIPMTSFLGASLAQAVQGKPVVEKRSPLVDMMGDEVGPEELSIYSNGQKPTGFGTFAIDAEGVPQKKNSIIERGVLKGFIFDSYWGNAFGVESTGNAARQGGRLPYEGTVSTSVKWLDVSPGKRSYEEIIASIDGPAIELVDIPIGIGHSNISTGEFSCVANSAYLVENGERKHSIKQVSFAGHFYKGLKNVVEIGSNVESLPFGMDVPTMVFDGFTITVG